MFKKVIFLFIFLFSISFSNVFAENTPYNNNYGLDNSTLKSNFGESSVPVILGRVIQIVMGLSATVMLIMIIYAGIKYIMAMGDANKQKDAIKLITGTSIGIIIIVAAYAISSFIINQIQFIAKSAS